MTEGANRAARARGPRPRRGRRTETPLVSCLMPTANRADYVEQSIRYFRRQSYPARELVIVDDGTDDLASRIRPGDAIRYVHLGHRHSIGVKRNIACELAHGAILAQWDDDDLYDDERLSVQVAPLLAGRAEITGLAADLFFELDDWRFWSCDASLRQRLFYQDVMAGTLVFRRRVWEAMARYPDCSLAEDARFLRRALKAGARLTRLRNRRRVIYLRHGRNSWSFRCGETLDPTGWHLAPEPPMTLADRAFYAARSKARSTTHAASRRRVRRRPLVSCLMPTGDRPRLASQAIRAFQRQDYEARELVIVDGGRTPLDPAVVGADPRIHYRRVAPETRLGARRNLACREAEGELLVHWDDDDWYASWRVRYQVSAMRAAEAELCGLDRLLYYEPWTATSWRYRYGFGRRAWVAGGSLCYARSYWRANPFEDVDVGEDNAFVLRAPSGSVLRLEEETFYVGMIHTSNTSPKATAGRCWQRIPVDVVADLMGDDLREYHQVLSDGVVTMPRSMHAGGRQRRTRRVATERFQGRT